MEVKKAYLKEAVKIIASVQDDMEYLLCALSDSNYENGHDWAVDILDNVEQLKSIIEERISKDG